MLFEKFSMPEDKNKIYYVYHQKYESRDNGILIHQKGLLSVIYFSCSKENLVVDIISFQEEQMHAKTESV